MFQKTRLLDSIVGLYRMNSDDSFRLFRTRSNTDFNKKELNRE